MLQPIEKSHCQDNHLELLLFWDLLLMNRLIYQYCFYHLLIEFDQKKVDYLPVPIDPFYPLNQMYKHLICSKQNYSQLCHN